MSYFDKNWRITLEMRPETHIVFVQCLIVLSDFNQSWNLAAASVIFQHLSSCYMRADEGDVANWWMIVAVRCERAKNFLTVVVKGK